MTACDFAPVRPGPSGSHHPSRGLPRGACPQPARPPPADALIGPGRPEPLQRRGDSAKLGGHPARGRSHAGSSRSSGSCALAPCRERRHHPAPGLCNYMWAPVSSRRRNPPPSVGERSPQRSRRLHLQLFGLRLLLSRGHLRAPTPLGLQRAPHPVSSLAPPPACLPASSFTSPALPTPPSPCLSRPTPRLDPLANTHIPGPAHQATGGPQTELGCG